MNLKTPFYWYIRVNAVSRAMHHTILLSLVYSYEALLFNAETHSDSSHFTTSLYSTPYFKSQCTSHAPISPPLLESHLSSTSYSPLAFRTHLTSRKYAFLFSTSCPISTNFLHGSGQICLTYTNYLSQRNVQYSSLLHSWSIWQRPWTQRFQSILRKY